MLTDVDKDGGTRSQPKPNTHDVLGMDAVMARGSNSVNYTTPATPQASISAAKNGQFTIVQSGVFPVPPFGSQPALSPGAGNYASASYVMETMAHKLQFTPGILSFVGLAASGFQATPYFLMNVAGTNNVTWENLRLTVDGTNVYFKDDVMSTGNGQTDGFELTYYLIQQTANV